MMDMELLRATTADGWRLAVYFHAGSGDRRFPVLMVHGFGSNRFSMDAEKNYSLAKAAAARGFAVYVLELRGAGESVAPVPTESLEYNWGFGDYLEQDMPAAMELVLEHAQSAHLHGVGHSMGGMLFYALATRCLPELKSIATIGAPLICELKLGRSEQRLLKFAKGLAPNNQHWRLPLAGLFGTAGRFGRISSRLADGILMNSDNVDADLVPFLAKHAMNDVPLKLLLEMTSQMAHQDLYAWPYGFERHLEKIEAPVLAMAGSRDRVAPPSSVFGALHRMQSDILRYREIGCHFGDKADYGHIDLLVGRHAPEEIYPEILDFLEEMDQSR
ncbi:MAG: alpha/beta hydrolase [Myxococcota bacterium]|jgi:pimeloyl-ACP methyl ester carboxylesterase|nr:alpha/beta hydrolase [Myxococcota bacterium]